MNMVFSVLLYIADGMYNTELKKNTAVRKQNFPSVFYNQGSVMY